MEKINYFGILALMIATGFWLSRKGKPYSVLIQTVHKLIGVSGSVYIGIAVYRQNQAESLSSGVKTVSIVAAFLFLGLTITGGLLATEKQMPALVLLTHKLMPYLAVITSGIVIWLIQ